MKGQKPTKPCRGEGAKACVVVPVPPADTVPPDTVIDPAPPPPPTPVPSGEGVDFIIGPQVPLGASPWPWFDTNQVARAPVHTDYALASIYGPDGDARLNSTYYDLALTLYGLHKRSADTAHLRMATSVAAAWWDRMPDAVAWDCWDAFNGLGGRHSNKESLIIYALQGGGTAKQSFRTCDPNNPFPAYTLWEWITGHTRHHWAQWLGRHLGDGQLWYGVRDGAYELMAVADLVKSHPDVNVRDEMLGYAVRTAVDYYARLQYPDGGWYWPIDVDGNGTEELASQPFMIGLLMEALIKVHQLTGNATVATSITKGVDWLWKYGYSQADVANLPGVKWRSMKYFVMQSDPGFDPYAGKTGEAYGSADGAIRDNRSLNQTTVHAFGYAYQLTGDPKYKTQGDEIFAATYGKGEGPGADQYWGLADYWAKAYGQSYRASGRYLAWRQ